MKQKTDLACVILAAGRGTRMKSAKPKVLHTIGSAPLLVHILKAVAALNPDKIVVVVAPDMDDVAAIAAPHQVAIQQNPLGSGDAARVGVAALGDFQGRVLILNGDMPLITPDSLQLLVSVTSDMGVMTTRADDPFGYGRIVTDSTGAIDRIVEQKDATDDIQKINRINAGGYIAKAEYVRPLLAALKPNNAQGELYITDIVQGAEAVDVAYADVQGVNTRAELALCESIFQNRKRAEALDSGVTLLDPASVYFAFNTKIANDVVVYPNVFFGPNVVIETGVTVKSFCHLEGVHIGKNASVGPYARLRPGTDIGESAYVGNFIEMKNTTLSAKAKAGHVGYLGDAVIGVGTNVGAGTITANYDGVNKHKTIVGDNVMLGVHSSLVAPLEIGNGAYIAAGSTVTKNVETNALLVARADQKQIKNWAVSRQKKEQ